MTREAFIRKWLGNMEKPYGPENRDNMLDDLDKVIDNNRPDTINPNPMTPTHYHFADKEVIDMMASIWGNEAARMFLTLSAFKYQMRAGRKTDDPTSDLEKARHCLELATQYHVIGPEWELLFNTPDDTPDTPNPNSSGNKPPQLPSTTSNTLDKENEWIDWNWFLDDPNPEPYLVVDLKITKCSDGEVRYGFGYWNPKTNNWSTLLEFDKSEHSIQWREIT
jgi:hypothetical protein